MSCVVCGNKLYGIQRKFCSIKFSKKDYHIRHRKQISQKRKMKKKLPTIPRKCLKCGKTFFVRDPWSPRKYCDPCGQEKRKPVRRKVCPQHKLSEFVRRDPKKQLTWCSTCLLLSSTYKYACSGNSKNVLLWEAEIYCPNCKKKTLFRRVSGKGDHLACQYCHMRFSKSLLNSGINPYFEKGKEPLGSKRRKRWRKNVRGACKMLISQKTTNGAIECHDKYWGYGKIGGRLPKGRVCSKQMDFHEIHGKGHENNPHYIITHSDDFIYVCHSHHMKRHAQGVLFGSY